MVQITVDGSLHNLLGIAVLLPHELTGFCEASRRGTETQGPHILVPRPSMKGTPGVMLWGNPEVYVVFWGVLAGSVAVGHG